MESKKTTLLQEQPDQKKTIRPDLPLAGEPPGLDVVHVRFSSGAEGPGGPRTLWPMLGCDDTIGRTVDWGSDDSKGQSANVPGQVMVRRRRENGRVVRIAKSSSPTLCRQRRWAGEGPDGQP